MVLKKNNYVVLLGEKDLYKNWFDDSVSESLVFYLVTCIRMTHSSSKQKKLYLTFKTVCNTITVPTLGLERKKCINLCVKDISRASLGAPWWRIHLPRQEIWVQSLIWEDPTCRRATKPVHHSYEPALWSPGVTTTDMHAATSEARMPWSCVPQKGSHCHQRLSQRLERSPRSPQPEKSSDIDEDPAQPKIT